MALAQQRFDLEKQLKLLDAQLKVEEHRRNTIADAVKASMAGEEQQGIDAVLATGPRGGRRRRWTADPRLGGRERGGMVAGAAPRSSWRCWTP